MNLEKNPYKLFKKYKTFCNNSKIRKKNKN